jgi:hypothetical protein
VRSLKALLYSFDLGLCLEIEPDVHRSQVWNVDAAFGIVFGCSRDELNLLGTSSCKEG